MGSNGLNRSRRKVLITGGSGFIGCYLSHALLEEGGVDVVLTRRSEPTAAWQPPGPWTEAQQRATIVQDIRDRAGLQLLLAEHRPDEIYHLAAQSLPVLSWQQPALTFDTNTLGTVHLFESLKELGLKPRVFVACSSAEYGLVAPEMLPLREHYPLLPLHPYGVSKVAQDLLAYQYWKNDGIPSIRARIFNTTGPGKQHDVLGDVTQRVVAAERQPQSSTRTLRVGNLSTRRDITDVRDQVRAIIMVTRLGVPGEVYNLCSGRTISIRELLDAVLRFSRVPLTLEPDPALARPSDEPELCGDNSKLVALTGYRPEIPLEQTVREALENARTQLRSAAQLIPPQ